ncbi:uncharacterized protein AB675_925 [Cyphellophora attinorum]|uniref:Uncharacterized protein n=1 Tax=Cyphellophora attinorum TaxID=1664694 RepID=A0A0N1HB63_9EURO|nr:uncharacterized protein AB675_925 [Phialophora attinorum]KPI45670.1 hypothetical protein AB675_925 [Phialophora attinorum]
MAAATTAAGPTQDKIFTFTITGDNGSVQTFTQTADTTDFASATDTAAASSESDFTQTSAAASAVQASETVLSSATSPNVVSATTVFAYPVTVNGSPTTLLATVTFNSTRGAQSSIGSGLAASSSTESVSSASPTPTPSPQPASGLSPGASWSCHWCITRPADLFRCNILVDSAEEAIK